MFDLSGRTALATGAGQSSVTLSSTAAGLNGGSYTP